VPRIALDLEAAGFHRYSDRLCLVQISTQTENFLLDPLILDLGDSLRGVLEDQAVQVVMHGADYDIRLLDRDLGIRLRGLFDTQAAASLLGATGIGLASLLEEYLGVKLSKKHQRADWAQRPLPEGMLEYAASDTRFLMELADLLKEKLEEKGRLDWAREEFALLEGIRWEEDTSDPILRVKGARDLTPRAVTALREAMRWRDGVARDWDRAPFRVAGDTVLFSLVVERPASVEELARRKGISSRLAHQKGEELLDRLRKVDHLSAEDLIPYPRHQGNGPGRPTPEEEAMATKLRDLRTDKAQTLEVDRGVLLSNAQIIEIVRRSPKTLAELEAVPGLRRWQAEILGDGVLALLKQG
jgi:ribonuclease D